MRKSERITTGFLSQLQDGVCSAIREKGNGVNGRVAIKGWRQLTNITPLEMIAALERWCSAFLYTHVDTEGLMQGFPLKTATQLRAATSKQLIVAGGIATSEQIDQLHALRIDAVVGMAIYTGRIKLSDSVRNIDQRST